MEPSLFMHINFSLCAFFIAKCFFIDFFVVKCYSIFMGDKLFRWYCYNKDGSMNYERASKFFGLSKSDLIFLKKTETCPIEKTTLMSGVFVGYHPTSENPIFFAPWNLKTCYHSKKDLSFIQKLIFGVPETIWDTYDYFIMDANGKMLFKNCNISQTINENGVIHLKFEDENLDYFVYPAQRKDFSYKNIYCFGNSYKNLNLFIKELIKAKIILKPRNFNKGFIEETQSTKY